MKLTVEHLVSLCTCAWEIEKKLNVSAVNTINELKAKIYALSLNDCNELTENLKLLFDTIRKISYAEVDLRIEGKPPSMPLSELDIRDKIKEY